MAVSRNSSRRPVASAVANTITLGPLTGTQLQVLVRELGGLHRLDPGIRGVLGQNVLNGADYLIDYEHRRLEFDDGGDLLRSISGGRTPFTRLPGSSADGALVIHTVVVDGSSQIRNLVLDSGTGSMVLFDESSAASRTSSAGFVQDAEGKQQPTALRHVQLQIGSSEWNLLAHSLRYYESIPDVDGLIPASLFPRLYISNSGGFVMLSPKLRRRSALPGALANR